VGASRVQSSARTATVAHKQRSPGCGATLPQKAATPSYRFKFKTPRQTLHSGTWPGPVLSISIVEVLMEEGPDG
jgi:hypothetical protein